jgi:hypothetical protein
LRNEGNHDGALAYIPFSWDGRDLRLEIVVKVDAMSVEVNDPRETSSPHCSPQRALGSTAISLGTVILACVDQS